MQDAREQARLLSAEQKELEKKFRWKAENNIRFFDKLGMTTEQKVTFLAQEFARVYQLAQLNERIGRAL